METACPVSDNVVTDHYSYAAHLLVNEKMSAVDTKVALVAKGVDSEAASVMVENLEKQITDARKERANKDMLYGALWCVGGIVGTAAQIGFIFWGAILFGGIQFFKGLANA